MADNYNEMDVVMQNDSWQLCTERLLYSYRGHSKDREVHINIILSGFCFHFHSVFCLFVSFLLFFMKCLWVLYMKHSDVRFFVIVSYVKSAISKYQKKKYICLVFFNYISYMAISKGQIIKSRQWSEIMSRVRNEEKPQRCWFNWSNV